MRRRDFLGVMSAQVSRPALAQSTKPNILLIMADQHSPHVLGCYGDPVVRTPNLNALAASGALFEHAYCQSPLCVPSRMSFLVGRQPSDIEVWGNSDSIPPDVPTFAHSLGAAGYETTLIGRMHFEGVDRWHGFEKYLVGDPSSPDSHYPFLLPPELLVAATNNSRQSVSIAGPGHTAYQSFDEDVTRASVDYLRQRKDKRPFCAVVGFLLPHSPYICERTDWDYYLNRVTIPETPPSALQNLHPAVRAWRKTHGIETVSAGETRRARAAYYSLIAQMDRQVGRILAALRESGLERNTVVIYTSDHGDMAGENGMWWKMNFYEGSVGVPLILSWPGQIKAGQRVKNLVGLVNVAPTLIGIAGAPALPHCKSPSLLPLVSGGSIPWIDEVYSELGPLRADPAMRMVRSGNWKLIHYEGYRPQLFDLEIDPHEYRDLGDDPAHAVVREQLHRKALAGWSAERIAKVMAERSRDRALIRRWGAKVHPERPATWHAPAGANVFVPQSPE